MAQLMDIRAIRILGSGEISIEPEETNELFAYIFRAATGVRWDLGTESFISQVPNKWPVADWFENIISSVKSELGVHLKVSQKTSWKSVSPEIRNEIETRIESAT